MGPVTRRLRPMVLLAGLLGGGCHTTVGNWLGNRARDLGECVRVELRLGPGLGAGCRVGGVIDVGLLVSTGGALGWSYGRPLAFGNRIEDWFVGRQLDVMMPGGMLGIGDRWAGSIGVPSALWTWRLGKQGRRWIWDPPGQRHLEVHAFDVEAYAHAAVAGIVLGFSPGELVDFLLGWFGADVAGDDRPLEPVPTHEPAG